MPVQDSARTDGQPHPGRRRARLRAGPLQPDVRYMSASRPVIGTSNVREADNIRGAGREPTATVPGPHRATVSHHRRSSRPCRPVSGDVPRTFGDACTQKVRGSNPLSSTPGQEPVPISETGLFHARTAATGRDKMPADEIRGLLGKLLARPGGVRLGGPAVREDGEDGLAHRSRVVVDQRGRPGRPRCAACRREGALVTVGAAGSGGIWCQVRAMRMAMSSAGLGARVASRVSQASVTGSAVRVVRVRARWAMLVVMSVARFSRRPSV
jgi:hypothetical protein